MITMQTLRHWPNAVLARAVRAGLRELVDRDPTLVQDMLSVHRVHGDSSRLTIDPTAVVNDALLNVSGGLITIERHAFFGHGVSVLTGTHDIERFGLARQRSFPRSGRDVRIGTGAWVASNAILLGPCTVGDHAVVGAGSLVRDDVAAYTVVAGTPARVIRTIPHGPVRTPPGRPDPTPDEHGPSQP